MSAHWPVNGRNPEDQRFRPVDPPDSSNRAMPGDRLTASGLEHDFLQNRYIPTNRAERPAILSAGARAGVTKKQVLIVPARVDS
jgi:hypothetical protein